MSLYQNAVVILEVRAIYFVWYMWATDYRVTEDFCKPYNVCMDFKADYKIPGDQEGVDFSQ